MKVIVSILFFVVPFCFGQQERFVFSGYVQEAKSAERLIGATVWVPALKIGTTTNKQGFFSLKLPSDSLTILFSFVGFTSVKLQVSGKRDSSVTVSLKPLPKVAEVEILALKSEDQRTQISAIEIPVVQIRQAPALMGESDVFKVLQLMPGIKGGMEGSSNFYVRGGGAEQNLILLDDVPIYNPFHLLGFMSVFNPSTLKKVEIYKGGFPARYGGRLSSVLDMTMKEGNLESHQAEANIGVISSNLAIEGPILKQKVSYLVGGRISYLDVWLNTFSKSAPNEPRPSYALHDLNAKVSADLSHKDRLQFSAYQGKDRYKLTEQKGSTRYESGISWQNKMINVRWGRVWNNRLFSSTKAYQVGYDLSAISSIRENIGAPEIYTVFKFVSGIQDHGLKTDWEYSPRPQHQLRFGASAVRHLFSPGISRLQVKDSSQMPVDTLITPNRAKFANADFAIYAENEFQWKDNLWLNIGIHTALLRTSDINFWSIQPRMSFRYVLPLFTIKAGFSTMQQPLHLVTSSGLGLSTDLWVPATKKVLPQTSQQWDFALVKSLPKMQTELSFETYYKTMKQVTEYKPDAIVIFDFEKNWEEQVTQGIGTSFGVEVLVHKKAGRLNGWMGYTLSRSTRQFDLINSGEVFPYKYDRTHDISFVLNYRLSPRLKSNMVWVYGTGNAVTLPESVFEDLVDIGKINAHRLDASHRLDLSVRFEVSPQLNPVLEKSSIVAGVYNTYNRKNPVYAYLTKQNGNWEFLQISLFPILPYISFNIKL